MPKTIMIRRDEQGTKDDMLREYVDTNRHVATDLIAALEKLCERHRKAYQDFLVADEMNHIENYLHGREPNESAYETYLRLQNHAALKGADKTRAEFAAQRRQHWVQRYTDHPFVPELAGPTERQLFKDWMENKSRPEFEVKKKRGLDKILQVDKGKIVDEIFQEFTNKVLVKVIDILIKHPTYKVELEYGSFASGSFEGDVRLDFFKTGQSFRMHLITKTNFSVNHTPFMQYPLTFHQVVTGKGAEPVASMSLEEVQTMMGVKPWKPPTRTNKWSAIQMGDVVRLDESDDLWMVIAQKGEKATVISTDAQKREVVGDDIIRIEARTSARENWVDNSQKEWYVIVEPAGCKSDKIVVSAGKEKVFAGLSDIKAARLARELALPMIVASWPKLTANKLEPPPPRRRWR